MSIVLVIVFLDQKRKLKGHLRSLVYINKFLFLFLGDDFKGVLHTSVNYSLKTLKQLIKLDHILLAPLTFSTYASVTFIFAVYTVVSCSYYVTNHIISSRNVHNSGTMTLIYFLRALQKYTDFQKFLVFINLMHNLNEFDSLMKNVNRFSRI